MGEFIQYNDRDISDSWSCFESYNSFTISLKSESHYALPTYIEMRNASIVGQEMIDKYNKFTTNPQLAMKEADLTTSDVDELYYLFKNKSSNEESKIDSSLIKKIMVKIDTAYDYMKNLGYDDEILGTLINRNQE
jgi:hypothetical protein